MPKVKIPKLVTIRKIVNNFPGGESGVISLNPTVDTVIIAM